MKTYGSQSMIAIVKCHNNKASSSFTSRSYSIQQLVCELFRVRVCPRAAMNMEKDDCVSSFFGPQIIDSVQVDPTACNVEGRLARSRSGVCKFERLIRSRHFALTGKLGDNRPLGTVPSIDRPGSEKSSYYVPGSEGTVYARRDLTRLFKSISSKDPGRFDGG